MAEAIRVHVSPPLLLRQTREFEEWKKTRPVGSRFAGVGTIAVKKPNPTSLGPDVAAAQFRKTAGGLLPGFVRREEPFAIQAVFRVETVGSTRIIRFHRHCPWQMFMFGMEPGTGFVGCGRLARARPLLRTGPVKLPFRSYLSAPPLTSSGGALTIGVESSGRPSGDWAPAPDVIPKKTSTNTKPMPHGTCARDHIQGPSHEVSARLDRRSLGSGAESEA